MTTTAAPLGEPVRGAGAARLRRPAAGLAAQLINAGTNVSTAYAASLLLSPAGFGSFVLAFALVSLVCAAARGMIGSSMLAHLAAVAPEERPGLVRSAVGFTLLVGLAGTALLFVAAVWEPSLLWFAPWFAVVALQDLGRYVFLAIGRTSGTLVLDVTWAVAQAIAILVWCLAGGAATIAVLATGWGVGALAGLIAFVVLVPTWARPVAPGIWARATRDVSVWFTITAVVGQAEIYLVLLLIGILLGPAETGAVRAVQLFVLQPPLVVLGAIIGLIVPAYARIGRGGPSAALRAAWGRAAALVAPLVVVVFLVALAADPIMRVVFPQYRGSAGLALPVAVQAATFALAVPSIALLSGTRRAATSVALQGVRVVLVLVAVVVGSALAGTAGVAWGVAIAAVASLAVLTAAARRFLRSAPRAVPDREVTRSEPRDRDILHVSEERRHDLG